MMGCPDIQSIGQLLIRASVLEGMASRVMVNEALGYYGSAINWAQQEVLMEQLPDTEEDDDGVGDIPQAELMKMIAELPDGYRTVFNLYVFEDKSHKEIAQLLGITEHTSSSQFIGQRPYWQRKSMNIERNYRQ